MKIVTRIFMVTALAALLAVTVACNDNNRDSDSDIDIKVETKKETGEEADKASLARMEAEIDDFIGEATCHEAGDCRTIPFGAKPCGGPWKFKVFGASSGETAKLEAMVAKYNLFNAELNEKYGWMSDCLAVMPPEIECVDGKCVVVTQ